MGYAAKTAGVPVRAMMDYIQKHELPYYTGVSDGEEGLRKVSQIRSSL